LTDSYILYLGVTATFITVHFTTISVYLSLMFAYKLLAYMATKK